MTALENCWVRAPPLFPELLTYFVVDAEDRTEFDLAAHFVPSEEFLLTVFPGAASTTAKMPPGSTSSPAAADANRAAASGAACPVTCCGDSVSVVGPSNADVTGLSGELGATGAATGCAATGCEVAPRVLVHCHSGVITFSSTSCAGPTPQLVANHATSACRSHV